MFSISVRDNTIFLSDIRKDNLEYILPWYNKIEDFIYATGLDVPIAIEDLLKKYEKILKCNDEFFVGIYINQDEMIGILQGKLHYQSRKAVWITTIVIARAFQRKGYGRNAIELLLSHLKHSEQIKSAYLAVIEENIKGRLFWTRLKFQSLKRIEKHIKLLDKHRSVFIMYKRF